MLKKYNIFTFKYSDSERNEKLLIFYFYYYDINKFDKKING